MRTRSAVCLVTAIAFLTYSVFGFTVSYAEPRAVTVEVKPGTMTGKIMNIEEKPLAGKTVKVLDATGAVKYSAVSADNGTYAINELAVGTYTLIMADTQKVTLRVKSDSGSSVINAMLPVSSKPYAAGAAAGLTAPLIVAIAGGAVLVGVASYGIASYDSKTHTKVSP